MSEGAKPFAESDNKVIMTDLDAAHTVEYFRSLDWCPANQTNPFPLYAEYDIDNGETVYVVWDWRGAVWRFMTQKSYGS